MLSVDFGFRGGGGWGALVPMGSRGKNSGSTSEPQRLGYAGLPADAADITGGAIGS